jgi:hypothetical protein
MLTPIELQLTRGTYTDVAAYTGAQGEAVVDTTSNRLAVQDGTTAGGWPAARIADLPAINVALPPYNAVIDGTTNNSTVVQNAINALGTSGGTVFFPPGTCVAYGLTVPAGVILAGAGGTQQASVLTSGGADATVVTLNGSYSGLANLQVTGGGFGTTHPAVVVTAVTGNDEVTIRFCHITGGTNPLSINNAGEVIVEGCNITLGYGGAAVYCTSGGGYFIRCKIDQSWKGQVPGPGVSITPWPATTPVAFGALYSLSGYLIQAQNAGMTGSTAPTLQNYGLAIVDGGVTWNLRAPLNYYGIQLDTSSALVAEACDFSGAHTAAIAMTNTLSGQPPVNVQIMNCTSSDYLNNALYCDAGSEVVLVGNLIGDGHLAGSEALQFTSTWLGDVTIVGNTIGGGDTGISIEGGKRCNINSNRIYGMSTAAIHIAAGVTDFTIVGNDVGGAYTGAPNAVGVLVDAGSSDHYKIALNNTNRSTTGISDGGTGADKVVQYNAAPLRQSSIPANPTGTSSSSRVMMGLGITFVPQTTGNVMFVVQGSLSNTTASDGGSVALLYGTGTPPANGVATTGISMGAVQNTGVGAGSVSSVAVSLNGYTAGLTVGTTYWFDMDLKVLGGGTASLANIQVVIVEL